MIHLLRLLVGFITVAGGLSLGYLLAVGVAAVIGIGVGEFLLGTVIAAMIVGFVYFTGFLVVESLN